MKSRKFVDSVVLRVRGGRGGQGCVSFRREKFVPRGGPDGGDGGRGGHVILRGDRDEDTLASIALRPDRRAPDGGHGSGKRQHGRNGRDLSIAVPCGTEVRDAETGEMLGDVVAHGQELTAARGGAGGLGNAHCKGGGARIYQVYSEAEAGREATLRLELRLMADVGLVGFPNAGKSSLLRSITHAHPKVAAYPFTTLNPVLGTLVFEDLSRIRVADVPGLVNGAHRGVGLGHAFLRHVERARCLACVIDMAGADGREPWEDYRILCAELALHRADLAERPRVIVANKMDLPAAGEHLSRFIRETGTDPVPVSALARTGLERLKAALRSLALEQPGDAAGHSSGKGTTESMCAAPASSMCRRSMPSATPPQGGSPSRSASRKASSFG